MSEGEMIINNNNPQKQNLTLADLEIIHRVKRKVRKGKKENKSKFGKGEIFDIYSTLHTSFGGRIK